MEDSAQDAPGEPSDPEWVPVGVQVEVSHLDLGWDVEDAAQDAPGELPDTAEDMPEQPPDLEWVPAAVPDQVLDVGHLVLDVLA